MKKLSFFLATGALLALASCQPEADSSMTDAQIDSMVNARVEEIRMQMMAQNDSLINAMAQTRADSIIAAMKGGNSVVTKKTTTTTTTVKPTPKPETIGNGKPKIGTPTDPNTVGNGKPKIGDKPQEGTVGNGKPKIGR